MNITGTDTYSIAQYLWQGQQLTSNSSSSSSGSSSSSSLFDSSSTMVDQVSGMLELAKYAMDSMGLLSDSRVTFSQVTKYAQQLQEEFTAAVQQGLQSLGTVDTDSLVFTLSDGKLTAQNADGTTNAKAESYLSSNASLASALANGLADVFGGTVPDDVSFTLGTDGSIQLSSAATTQNVEDVRGNAYSQWLQDREEAGESPPSGTMVFEIGSDGHLVATDAAGAAFLEENEDIVSELEKELEEERAEAAMGTGKGEPRRTGLQLDAEGASWIVTSGPTEADVASLTGLGQLLRNGLDGLSGKTPNFALRANDDGTVTVSGSGEQIADVQAFFDDNPELVKQYQQIVALAGIDDARKALSLDPSVSRKRVQLESIASSWYSSDSSSSYFGQYSDESGLSLLAGLNLSV